MSIPAILDSGGCWHFYLVCISYLLRQNGVDSVNSHVLVRIFVKGEGPGFHPIFLSRRGKCSNCHIGGGEGEDYIVVCLGFYTKFVGEGIV